jgi:hypothetical protein
MGLLLLLTAVLVAACSSNPAVDVNPAKDDVPTRAEPPDEATPIVDAANDAADPTADDQANEAIPEALADPPADEDTTVGDQPGNVVDPGDPDDEPAAVADRPDETEAAEVVSRSVEAAAPATGNGWRRISPIADLVDVAASGGGQHVVVAEQGRGLLTNDGGATWATLDWPGEHRSAIAIDPSGRHIVVAGFAPAASFETPALFTKDAGFTWAEANAASPAVSWFVLDSFLYATLGLGVIASNDGAETATVLGQAGEAWPANSAPFSVHVNPQSLDEFAVVSISEGGRASIRISSDGGDSWGALASEFPLFGVTVVVFSGIGPMIMSQGVGFLISFYGGTTWFVQNSGIEQLESDGIFTPLRDFVFLPLIGAPVIATSDAVFAFDPGGWTEFPGPPGAIRALAVRQSNPEELLAATDTGLWAIPTDFLQGR